MFRPTRRLLAAALGVASLTVQARAQDTRGGIVVIEPSIAAASAAPNELRATRVEMRKLVTTADVTVPAGVNPNLTPAPTSGSPTGFNDPRLGFNNPRYWAKGEQYSGVTQLIMTYDTRNLATGATGTAGFLCTGSLINGGRSVLTAAHCLNNSVEAGVEFTLRNVQVRLGQNFGGNTTAEPGAGAPSVNQSFSFVQTVNAENVKIHPDYSGAVIDQRDVAVINLNSAAPSTFRSYELHAGDAFGQERNVVGYGGRGNGEIGTVNAGGSTGSQQRVRQGLNTFDISGASPLWRDAFSNDFLADGRGPQDVYLEDFDNGLAPNNALCRISFAILDGLPIWLGTDAQRPCGLGLGINEVGIAGGDSGGPSFISGRIAGISSFGLSFGPGFGDFRAGLNSSFGELAGMTRVDINRGFIEASVIPEPSTVALVGFGVVALAGLAARRRSV